VIGYIDCRGIEHLDRTGRMAHERLGIALYSKYLRCARHGGELDRGLSDLPVASEDQHDIAFARTPGLA
jgi:hypothetical protein